MRVDSEFGSEYIHVYGGFLFSSRYRYYLVEKIDLIDLFAEMNQMYRYSTYVPVAR